MKEIKPTAPQKVFARIFRFGSAFLSLITLLSFATTLRAQSPPGCNANNVFLNISVQAPINSIVTNGQTAIFAVTVGNPNNTAGGAFVSCDATGMTISYECPGANGQPSGIPTVLATNVTLNAPPPGPNNETNFFNLPCVINVGTNTVAVFRSTVTNGFLQSVQPAPFNRQSTINLTVVHPSIDITKQCVSVTNIGGGQVVITYSGTVTNTGDEQLINVLVVNNQPVANTPVLGPITLMPGAGTNFVRSYTNSVNECGPFPDTLTVTATGIGSGAVVTDQASANCTITYTPCIAVTKNCDTVLFGQANTVSGIVTNCGNITLTNISIVDNLYGTLASGITLTPHTSTSYSRLVTNNSCGTFTNIVTATGTSICGGSVTNRATNACVVVATPCIAVTKNCNTVTFGQPNTVSGVVSNCGNITLTGISIVDNLYGTLTNGITLAPGASVNYSRLVTNNNCGNFTNIVTATGTSTCGSATNSATNVCVVVATPCIAVTKNCTTAVIGQPNTVSGVVSNCGNITLTGISIVDNLYGTLTNGITLAPGASANYSQLVTNNNCGNFTNIVTATGTSTCGSATNSATNVCVVVATPCIAVTKNCDTVVIGQPNTVSGVVSNCGNITLTGISIVDNLYGILTNGITLAPGASANYSRLVTNNTCGAFTNIVTATGSSTCGSATNSATNVCVVVATPCIAVTKNCDTVVIGQPNTVSGVVSNCGNITLTGISIVDNLYGTLTNGITLAPGASANYSRLVTNNTCGAFTNIVTATGSSTCGSATNRATNVCVVVATPCIAVTKNCNTVTFGQPNTVSGVVSNCGNITLTGITIVDNLYGTLTNGITLAPGASANYSRLVTNNTCGAFTNIVTATGSSTCGSATNSATNVCVVVATPCIAVTKNCNTVTFGQPNTVSGVVSNCGNITLTGISIVDNLYGTLTNGITLAPGASVNYSRLVTNTNCGNFTNIVTATGSSTCGSATNSATNVCVVVATPSISVTKNCDSVFFPSPNTVSGVVSNSGNITLTGVTVVDNLYGTLASGITLAPGATSSYSRLVTNACLDAFITNTVTATGNSACGSATNTATAVCEIKCPAPCIGITKEIACYLGNNVCGTFAATATGVKGDLQDPAFCYRITITNCGLSTLTNVTVIDNQFGNLTTNFFNGVTPGTLAVGQTITYEYKAELGANTTNTATVAGNSAVSGERVSTNDTAIAIVIPASIECNKIAFSVDDTDGDANNSTVVLPGDGAAHTVIWSVVVFNTGQAGLTNVIISDPGCTTNIVIPSLAAGASVTSVLCQAEITSDCTNFVPGLLTNTVIVSATVDTGTNQYCAFDIDGTNITVRSECSATVSWECAQEGCRQTGGGRQPGTSTYTNPALFDQLGATPRYVTHGGQVGAPVGRETTFDPDSDCIHGRLTHVRHIKGGLKGNFQARSFDSLMCACLGCPENPGSGVTVGEICNPGDRVCGPEPRKAGANKIAFSGVGNYALTNGRRTPRSVLFRVDIEDRSEPGGSKPGGATPPADRYRIRIWVLTATELAALNNPNNRLCVFRQSIAATEDNVVIKDGAPGALGSAVFGVRAPDIDDGGELERGNHQLHPAIKPCLKPLHTCP